MPEPCPVIEPSSPQGGFGGHIFNLDLYDCIERPLCKFCAEILPKFGLALGGQAFSISVRSAYISYSVKYYSSKTSTTP